MESNIGIKALADRYRDKRLRHEWLEAQAKEARKQRDAAEAALVDAMCMEEVTAIRTDDGVSYGVRRTVNYSCPAEHRRSLVQSLLDAGQLDSLSVNAQTLNRMMKEEAELNGGELPERFSYITSYERPGISVTRLKKLNTKGDVSHVEDE